MDAWERRHRIFRPGCRVSNGRVRSMLSRRLERSPAASQVNADARKMRAIAETVIASGATGPPGEAGAALTFSIGELRPNLLILMGRGGFRALVARALSVAGNQVPWLRGLRSKEDGTFDGMELAYPKPGQAEVQEGRVVLLTEVLVLLLQLLGPGMTLAVVSDTWPNAPLDDVDLGRKEKS